MDQWRRFFQAQRLRDVKKKRRAHACQVLRAFKTAHPSAGPHELQPSPADFCHSLPAIRKLIDRPMGDEVVLKDFEAVTADLPSMLQTWRCQHILTLAKHAFPDASYLDYDAACARLQLATTVFECKGDEDLHEPPGACGEPLALQSEHGFLWWPHALHHGCCRADSRVDACERARTQGDAARALGPGYDYALRKPLDWTPLCRSSSAGGVAAQVVRACGKDPAYTTAAEMDALDPRLMCLKCTQGARADGKRVECVRGWRSSVSTPTPSHWSGTLTCADAGAALHGSPLRSTQRAMGADLGD
jgi:hypothetical protein